ATTGAGAIGGASDLAGAADVVALADAGVTVSVFDASAFGASAFGASAFGASALGASALGASAFGASAFGGSTFGGAAFGGSDFAASALTSGFESERGSFFCAPDLIGDALPASFRRFTNLPSSTGGMRTETSSPSGLGSLSSSIGRSG